MTTNLYVFHICLYLQLNNWGVEMLHDLGFKYKYVVLLVWNIGVFSCPNKYVDMYISCDIFFLLIALVFLYQVVMWIFIFNFFHLFNIKDMLKMVQKNAFSISFQMELFAKVFILKKPFFPLMYLKYVFTNCF